MSTFEDYTEVNLKYTQAALDFADYTGNRAAYWDTLLTNVTEFANGGTNAELAVRMYISSTLRKHGGGYVIRELKKVLEDPNSDWSSLGLFSVNDATVGEPFTAELKAELLGIIEGYSVQFLQGFQAELAAFLPQPE